MSRYIKILGGGNDGRVVLLRDMSFNLGATLYLTGETPPITNTHSHPQHIDCCDDAATDLWWSVSVENLSWVLFDSTWFLQDFGFPGSCDGTCSSITKVPEDLDTSMSSQHGLQQLLVTSNIKNFLVLSILCMKE